MAKKEPVRSGRVLCGQGTGRERFHLFFKSGQIMSNVITHLITVFFSYLAIMNPLSNTAVFVSLTSDLNAAQKKR